MTPLVPDSYTISHFTSPEDGHHQANIFLTARVSTNGTFGLVGRPRYFEDAAQEWMISKHIGESSQLFSICNIATGHYLSRSPGSNRDSGSSLMLSNVQNHWRILSVDMSYSITSHDQSSRPETLQVHFGGTSRKSIYTDDSPIHLLPSPATPEPYTGRFHLWTFIPTFRVTESPEVPHSPVFRPQLPLQIPSIQAPEPTLLRTAPELTGTFYVKHPSSGLVLDLYYSLSVDNTPVTLGEVNEGPSQVWKIMKKLESDSEAATNDESSQVYYWIQNVASGTYLSFSQSGVVWAECFVTGNSVPLDWVLQPVGDSEYPHFRLLAANTNLALDVSDDRSMDGAKVLLRRASQTQNQQFSFEPTRVISKRRSNSSFKVFKLLGTRARASSTVSLQTTCSDTSNAGAFLGSPDTSSLFVSDLA